MVAHFRGEFGVSERRASGLAGQPSSVQRYVSWSSGGLGPSRADRRDGAASAALWPPENRRAASPRPKASSRKVSMVVSATSCETKTTSAPFGHARPCAPTGTCHPTTTPNPNRRTPDPHDLSESVDRGRSRQHPWFCFTCAPAPGVDGVSVGARARRGGTRLDRGRGRSPPGATWWERGLGPGLALGSGRRLAPPLGRCGPCSAGRL